MSRIIVSSLIKHPVIRDRAASFRVGGLKKKEECVKEEGRMREGKFLGGGGGMLVDSYSISLK